jgi:hypothetical protein
MKVSSIRWGVIWIGIGLFFLAINLELLDSLVFPRLFTLWPVLLVAIGVELIFRHTKLYFLALLSPLLIAGAFIVAAYSKGEWGWKSDEFWQRWVWEVGEKHTDTFEIPSDTLVKMLDLNLECGPSRVTFQPTFPFIFKATTQYHKRRPYFSQDFSGGTKKVDFTNREKARLAIFGFNMASSESRFEISDELPLKIKLEDFETEPDINLEQFKISMLDLTLKARNATVLLGSSIDSVNVVISGKAQNLILIVPDGFGIAISGDMKNLAKLMRSTDFRLAGNSYQSSGFNPARVIIVTIKADISSLTVSTE